MATFRSEQVTIERTDGFVFDFLSDFNNFQKLMPPQVSEWHSDGDSCSFNIQNMATLGMRYKEKVPVKHIYIQSEGKVPFDFDLQCFIGKVDELSCIARLEFNADLSPMLKMIASKPLENFINILAQKLKEICESGKI
ncbi:MAG: SRPBCC family protein [Bacteroidales bacterium]|nr:SRPBCC family protein [Bacteroidales bacterium]MBK9358667.1 SRPBCC family protein [Bacteroidales bacterium]